MKFSDVIEFRKDVYFEGAVQADWFYNEEQSSKVAINYVFHGNQYYDGVSEQYNLNSNRVDSVTLLKKIAEKFNIEGANPLTLAIADYGTGKSHLAVTMGHLFSGPDYCPLVFNRVIGNISKISDEEGQAVKKLYSSKNFVIMLNGMKDFNLNSEILRMTQKSLKLYGIDDSFLSKISKTQETAINFLQKTEKSSLDLYEKYARENGWKESSDELISKIRENLLTDDIAFNIIDAVFNEVTGQNISWDSGISARSILDLLVSELCEKQKSFDHIVVLFDEFGRFLEYAAGVNNSGKTGDSALQQMFEAAQDAKGKIQIVNFIQSDIKTYLQRVDQTSNISRYIGRYDASDKYHISSNLETVFANLIYRKNKKAFDDIIIMWQCDETKRWQSANSLMNRWLPTKGIWKEYRTFRDVIVEGIYPLHPLSTYMLTQLSDYLQKRSSLALINNYIEQLKDIDIETEKPLIMPEQLMKGDLFNEMLAAEESGRQTSQFCISYNAIVSKIGDKLTETALKVLRANLILRVLKFKTNSYEDVKTAINFCTGLDDVEIKKALQLLEHEYAVLGFDTFANCFDFMADANGYHDYKIIKNRNLAKINISSADFDDIQIRKLFELDKFIETDFKINHNIQTNEWDFQQYFYTIDKFSESTAKSIVTDWENSKSFNNPKGKLVWIYLNKDSDPGMINKLFEYNKLIAYKPIVFMLLNDTDNSLWKLLQEYKCLLSFDDINRKKFEKYFNDDFDKIRLNIAEQFKSLKKRREYIGGTEILQFKDKMARELTKIFEAIYKKVVPFNFDGFTGNHGLNYYFTIVNLLLSDSINYDTIHAFPSEIRNRIEAILSYDAGNSWKCLSRDGKILPPENQAVRVIYDELKKDFVEKKKLPLAAAFAVFSMPPYGLCDEILLLLICVLIANSSYGLKITYKNNVYSLSEWRSVLTSDRKSISENEKKRLISIVKESTMIQVDAGAIEEKFLHIFDQIDTNRNLKQFKRLESELNLLTEKESVPDVLKSRATIADREIKDGLRALRDWSDEIETASGLLKDTTNKIDNALDVINLSDKLRKKFAEFFEKYDSEELENDIQNLKNGADSLIKSNFSIWLSTLKCSSDDDVIKLKVIERSIGDKLKSYGYEEYSVKLSEHITRETKDIDLIKEKVSLKKDMESFINKSSINEYTPIQTIDDILERGDELSARVRKVEKSLDEQTLLLVRQFKNKYDNIQSAKIGIDRSIRDVKESIKNLSSIYNISDIRRNINKLYGRGIDEAEYPEFADFLMESQRFQKDSDDLASCSESIKQFNEKKEELLSKYATVSIDFGQKKLLSKQIESIASEFAFKEIIWRRDNLEVEGKDRKYLIIWKDKIQNIPDYISEKTLNDIEATKKRVEEILSSQNIQTVIDYFEKLSPEEKKKCLDELNKRIGE